MTEFPKLLLLFIHFTAVIIGKVTWNFDRAVVYYPI